MSVQASYKSFCKLCRKAIELGQLIDKRNSYGWVHTACTARQSVSPLKSSSSRLDRPKYRGLDGRGDAAGKRKEVESKTLPTDPDFFNQPDDLDDLDLDRLDFEKLLMKMESPNAKPSVKPVTRPIYNPPHWTDRL